MDVSEVIRAIEKTAPCDAAASWDASGVQVAAMRREVRHVAVMLDPSLANLRCAADAGADFILAHHPLSLRPRFPNVRDDYLAVLSLLFTRDIWLYSAHTSLDASPRGPVLWLAHALAVTDPRLLSPHAEGKTGANAGFGWYGALRRPLPYADFCEALAKSLGKKEWLACGPVPQRVSVVACCPGSGGSLLGDALARGADLFITGDIKYHTALDAAAAGLRVLDVGHFILEEEMMRRFANELSAELRVPVSFFPGSDPLVPERVSGCE